VAAERAPILQREMAKPADADHAQSRHAVGVPKQWREYRDSGAHQRGRVFRCDGVRDWESEPGVRNHTPGEATLSTEAGRLPVFAHVVSAGCTLLTREVRTSEESYSYSLPDAYIGNDTANVDDLAHDLVAGD
jgi:hypothetical protein